MLPHLEAVYRYGAADILCSGACNCYIWVAPFHLCPEQQWLLVWVLVMPPAAACMISKQGWVSTWWPEVFTKPTS